MKWEELLRQVADEPVFRTGLRAGAGESRAAPRLQVSRWVTAGRWVQLAKGLYTLADYMGDILYRTGIAILLVDVVCLQLWPSAKRPRE